MSTVLAAGSHTGRVFVDANKNGVMDKGETPLAGVAVSDGLNVVKTGKDGSFTLPGHERENFVFITTPSGYRTDNRHYIRIAPGTASYDFGVQPSGGIAKDGSHRFIQITDTEIFNTENHEDWVGNVRNYAAGEGVAFIMHTGDICYEKGLREHIKLMNTENMNCPVFYGIGNHDLVKGRYGEELFEEIYGPTFYSFDVGNVHYIVVPMLQGDHKPRYTKADVYRWMKNDLAQVPKGKPVVVFGHDLLTGGNQFTYGIGKGEEIDLNARNLKAWIYGHMHINYMKQQGDVVSICTGTLDKGGIDHSTNAFRVISMDPAGKLTSDLRYTYLDRHARIAVPAGAHVPVYSNGNVPLIVNTYFSESPTESVTYSCFVDGKPVITSKPLKQLTDWSWGASMPLDRALAGKTLTVKTVSRFKNGSLKEAESQFVYKPEQGRLKPAGDWANLLGNARHDGCHAVPSGVPLTLAWVANAGGNVFMTSPLIYGGNVYVATVDENLKGEAAVVALNGVTGALLWKYPVRNSIKNTIAAGDSAIFVQDADGMLYAVDAKTGKLRWEKKLSSLAAHSVVDGLVVEGDVVYAGTGKGLSALNVKNGDVIWRNKGWNQHEGSTATLSLGEGVLAGSAQWSALYGNDAATGSLLWSNSKNGLRNRASSPLVRDGKFHTLSDKSYFELDAKTGAIIRQKEFPFKVDATSTPVVTEDEIIFGTSEQGVVALDPKSLDVKWQFKTGDALVYTAPYTRRPASTVETSPVLAGEIVFVTSSDGFLRALSRADGKELWSFSAGAPLLGSVAVSGNMVVVCDFGGNVYGFRMPVEQ